jgi:outer membrane immunogenic protein
MRKVLSAIAGFAAFVVTPAIAADMAVKALPAPATNNWSGFYAGVNAGGVWGTSDPSTSIPAPGSFLARVASPR